MSATAQEMEQKLAQLRADQARCIRLIVAARADDLINDAQLTRLRWSADLLIEPLWTALVVDWLKNLDATA